jgi:hypothetical protein
MTSRDGRSLVILTRMSSIAVAYVETSNNAVMAIAENKFVIVFIEKFSFLFN